MSNAILVPPEDMKFDELVFAFREKETHRAQLSEKLTAAKAKIARLTTAEETRVRTITELREQLEQAEDCINELLFVNDGQRETIKRLRGEIPDFKELGY